MIIWAEGVVRELGRRWPGAVELSVARTTGTPDTGKSPDTGDLCRALAYTDLTAVPAVGDRVLLNVAALEWGLGTGGYALVVAVLTADGSLSGQPRPPVGHLVKARYLPLQVMVAGADEQGSRFHDQLADADSIDGLPVVVADVHSALPAIAAAIQHDRPGTRICYLMSDHGALPLAFSRTVAGLVEAGALTATVTVGQAFGGDLEAVNVYSGLLAARRAADAEVVIITQGPGNLGTGTRWGFSGVAAGEAINAISILQGRPVGALRISGADPRARHRGVSHHSLTAYGRVALRPADIAVPDFNMIDQLHGIAGLDQVEALAAQVEQAVAGLSMHQLVRITLAGLDEALLSSPVPLSTMGRDLQHDPAYFLAQAAAGRHAASLLN